MSLPEPVHLETCSIVIRLDSAKVPRALELLHAAGELLRVRRGCRCCRIERDARNKNLLHYTEEWDDPEAFRRHLRSDEFLPVLIAMELASKEPEVLIAKVSGRRGVEVIAALREGKEADARLENPGREDPDESKVFWRSASPAEVQER